MEKKLIPLLVSAITYAPLTLEQKAAVTSEDLPALFKLAKKHDLAHLVAVALEQNQLISDPVWIERCFQFQTEALCRYEQSQYAFTELTSLFDRYKIPYVPLKGAIIRECYREAWLRTSCDLDVLVPQERVAEAAALMETELQYQRLDKTYHDISLASPFGVHVELHFHIKEGIDRIDRLLERVWEFAAADKGETCRFSLTSEFQLFHLLAHASYHFVKGGCGARSILDWWILRRQLPFDAAVLQNMCDSTGLSRFREAFDGLASSWFDGTPTSPLLEQMQKFIFYGGAYGNLENHIAVKRAESRSQKGKMSYLLSRAWLPISELRINYPILEKHPILTPFCQIARWSSAIKSGRIKKSTAEIRANKNVTEEQLQEVSTLLEALEL